MVGGATVTLRSEDTGATRTTTSAESGTYTFDAIPTGMYTVEIETKGFKKAVLRNNEVRIGQPTTVNATIDVGQVTEDGRGCRSGRNGPDRHIRQLRQCPYREDPRGTCRSSALAAATP